VFRRTSGMALTGYDFFFVNKDIRGCLYKNNNNMYMKIKKDDYDGTVKIWSSK